MKKLFTLLLLLLPISMFAQDFPYAKMVKMSPEELIDANFKYDKKKNQFILVKNHGLQATANILSALNGTTNDIRPDARDYKITVQYGPDGCAFVEVIFYADETYHDILTYASDNGENLLETNSSTLHKVQYNIGEFSMELTRRLQAMSTSQVSSGALAATKDNSYNIYTYVIFTGKAADSEWLQKEAAKQAKKDSKGKKKSNVSDLM